MLLWFLKYCINICNKINTENIKNSNTIHIASCPANNETKLCLRCMPVICRHCRQRISVKNMPQNCWNLTNGMLETAKSANSCSKSSTAICWQIVWSKLKTMYLHVVDFVQPVKNNSFLAQIVTNMSVFFLQPWYNDALNFLIILILRFFQSL